MSEKIAPTTLKSVLLTVLTLLWIEAPLQAGEARQGWQAEWERTVQAAKREASVNVYTHDGQSLIIESGAFQKKYPEIKIIYIFTRGAGTVQRIMSERRAGKYIADVAIHGGTDNTEFYRAKALDPLRPALILPEVVDESNWWLGRHPWVDTEQQYIFMHIGAAQPFLFGYNTQLANPKDFNSLWDLLDSRWKGKIVAYDIRAGAFGGWPIRFLYYHPKYGAKYIRDFYSKTDVTLSRDNRQVIDWLAAGKFAICFLCGERTVREAKLQGLQVDLLDLVKDAKALASQGATISLPNKAPHPNAAKVFLNWLLSREGQITAQKALAQRGSPSNSLRIDIPKDDVPPREHRIEGVQYIDVEHPSRLDMRPIIKTMEEGLRDAGKR